MTQATEPTLPDTLVRYFGNADRADAAALFALNAEVRDEGRSHAGLAGIRDWLTSTEQRHRPRYRVIRSEQKDKTIVVTFEVSGTFPGSPAVLQQAFTFDDAGHIATLATL